MDAVPWRSRLAGTLVGLVGLANVVVGAAGLLSERVVLSPAAAGGFLVLGLVTVVLASRVWRGSRLAAVTAFALFTLLLIAQVVQAGADPRTASPGITQPSTVRTGILVALVLSSGIAALPGRTASRRVTR